MEGNGKRKSAKAAGQAQAGVAGFPVQSIREVFGYLRRYRDQVFVLKIDDYLMSRPLFSLLIKDIVLLQKIGVRIILVPGAKHSIDKVLKTYRVSSPIKDDVRITTEEAMPLVKLGASNVTNVVLSLLTENGANGVVGNWVRARAMGVLNGLDYQHTGRVEKVDVNLINNMLDDRLIPIVPNIGWNLVGRDYNLSSSELAVAIAKAMRATKLFFIGVDTGIPVVPECDFADAGEKASGYFSNLDLEEGNILLRDFSQSLKFEHRELVSLAMDACAAGVDRVHFIDGSLDGILLQEVFSSAGHGTMFYANQYDKIRTAKPTDIPEILRIMQPYVDDGVLIQRSAETLATELENFAVYKIDTTLHGCAALKVYPDKVAELYAVVVDSSFTGQGTGRKIVSYLLDKARKAGVKTVFLLTTQTSDFFMRNGFREAPLTVMPSERQSAYNPDRNSRVLAVNL
ncbi:MAG: amino-acid N-acetyltransferase [Fibrobacterota bacterium]|nr:amino-acid N-acetyltransferase [Fibrobacterota bacterium]